MAGVGEFFAMTERDSFLTWLPLYHDWGLVCVALHSIVLGTNYTLLSPMHWIAKPVVAWEAVHEYRPTIYYHPNFAYNYMAQRIKASEMKGIDLSSVRLVCNGAEPCFYDSHRMFLEKFTSYGLPPGCLGIVYGMAEVTNSVFGAGRDEPIQVDPIDRERLQTEHRAVPVAPDAPNVLRMLGVGRSLRDTAWKILDDRRQELPERHVGEVAIRSRAAMHGYYRNPEATARAMHEGWYLSGDLGYRVGDKLFVTGRKSDLVIIGGVNIYPHDVENIAAEHPAVIAGRVAAIGVDDAALGTQRLIVIVESRRPTRRAARDREHVRPSARAPRRERRRVYHAPHRWLIETSSGSHPSNWKGTGRTGRSSRRSLIDTRIHACRNMEPLFFGPADHRCSAGCTCPPAAPRRTEVVLCHPFRAGVHCFGTPRVPRLRATARRRRIRDAALRLVGTGGSPRPEGSPPGTWTRDVGLASGRRERVRCDDVALVRMRLGATLPRWPARRPVSPRSCSGQAWTARRSSELQVAHWKRPIARGAAGAVRHAAHRGVRLRSRRPAARGAQRPRPARGAARPRRAGPVGRHRAATSAAGHEPRRAAARLGKRGRPSPFAAPRSAVWEDERRARPHLARCRTPCAGWKRHADAETPLLRTAAKSFPVS
jgi:hypothetical protein